MNQSENILRLKSGRWVDGFIPEFAEILDRCHEACFRFNSLPPADKAGQAAIIRNLLGTTGKRFFINRPFNCDFGFNISIGEDFRANFNLTILDEAEVSIGDNVFIGPNCTLCTITHAMEPAQRNCGQMCARPITIGDNVWIASNVVVLPGVTIGSGAVIGAGSVVTRDVQPYTLVAGNPARPIRSITPEDRSAQDS